MKNCRSKNLSYLVVSELVVAAAVNIIPSALSAGLLVMVVAGALATVVGEELSAPCLITPPVASLLASGPPTIQSHLIIECTVMYSNVQ
mgnify:CR=1 FL=1